MRGGFDRAERHPLRRRLRGATASTASRASIDDERWAELAADARAWFDASTIAGRAVYDRARGRVADGVDEGRVSENSGAEANIVAAEALIDEAVSSVPEAIALLPAGTGRMIRT